MNFNNLSYLPGILLAFLVFTSIVIILEKKFFRMIKTYWFYRRSKFSYVSTFLFLIGIGGLLVSLMDARGPEERIKTPVPVDRTIILIDTSASMLAEDIKPSRLQKAVLIAKHFTRKAVGHQLSVVVFAEIQKKIVPFTNDIDLIDSRLDSLKLLRNQYGSSALSAAIQESIQYFKESNGEARGNILVLTDGEETAGRINLNVPKEVHVAMVGIGTTQGGRIPLDDGRGFRFGYKKDKGQDIVTKLSEKYFQVLTSDIPSSKYWIANSYTLPSDEIIDFFNAEKKEGKDKQDMVIRPVMMEWIVIPALGCLILSYFFKALRIFSLGLLLVVVPIRAEDDQVKLSPEILNQIEQLKNGELNKIEKIKLADSLYRAGAKDESLALYSENLSPEGKDKDVPMEAIFNYGTALLEKGETQKALAIYEDLYDKIDQSPGSEKIKKMIEKNIVSSLQEQEKRKENKEKKDQSSQDDQKNKNQDQNQKQNESGDQNKPGNQKDQQGQQGKMDQKKQDQKEGQGEDKKDGQEGKDKDQEKKDQEGKDGKDKDQEDEGQGKDKDKDKDSGKPQGQDDKKSLPQKKVSAKLKQLMSDDRQLQMRMIENGTRELNKMKSRKNKDW